MKCTFTDGGSFAICLSYALSNLLQGKLYISTFVSPINLQRHWKCVWRGELILSRVKWNKHWRRNTSLLRIFILSLLPMWLFTIYFLYLGFLFMCFYTIRNNQKQNARVNTTGNYKKHSAVQFKTLLLQRKIRLQLSI